MPLYDFKCEKCSQVFEELCKMGETVECCVNCGAKELIKLPSSFSFKWGNPQESDLWRNSHDYRFWNKIEEAKDLRKQAEAHSPSPYNEINDLNNDEAWRPQ